MTKHKTLLFRHSLCLNVPMFMTINILPPCSVAILSPYEQKETALKKRDTTECLFTERLNENSCDERRIGRGVLFSKSYAFWDQWYWKRATFTGNKRGSEDVLLYRSIYSDTIRKFTQVESRFFM